MAFICLVTDIGAAKIAAAISGGGVINIVEGSVGDGGGAPTTPQSSDAGLVNETSARFAVNEITRTGNQVSVNFTVPASDGGYTVREAAVWDEDGDMVLVCSVPAQEKPAGGETGQFNFNATLTATVQDGDVVQVTVDPLAVNASRAYVRDNAVMRVPDLPALRALTGLEDGQQVSVASYRPGFHALAAPPVGGGLYTWCATRAKSDHDGGMVISNTVPWDGTDATLDAFISGTGETDPGGTGVFVKTFTDGFVRSTDYGVPENTDGSDTTHRDVPIAAQIAAAKSNGLNLDFDFRFADFSEAVQLDCTPGQKIQSSKNAEIRSHSTSYGVDIVPRSGGIFVTRASFSRLNVRTQEPTALAAWRIRASYCDFTQLGATTSATPAVDGYHLEADDSGSGPYYNNFYLLVAQGPQTGAQTGTGVRFTSTASIATRYPNANSFYGGRIGGHAVAVDFQGGGNEWYSPRCEGNTSYVFDFRGDVANGSTDNKVYNPYIEGASGVVPQITNANTRSSGVQNAHVTSIGGLADAAQWSGDRSAGCFYSNGAYSEKVYGGGLGVGARYIADNFRIDSLGANAGRFGLKQGNGSLLEIINSSTSSANLSCRFFLDDVENFRVGPSITGPSTNRDNAVSAGSATGRYSVVYAGTGTINTSDKYEKQQTRPINDAEKSVAQTCKTLIRAYKFNEAVENKGADARIHVGVIAQDVEAAFIDNGLDPSRYALFCRDVWYELDGEIVDSGTEGAERKERLGIRYDELLAFIISAL